MLDKCKECYEDNKTPDNSDCLKCDENYRCLEQENKELKEMLSREPKAMQAFQIAYSSNKKENEVLWGMVKDYKTALEEIREILKFYADSWVDEKIYPDLHYDNTKAKEGLSKINEVLQ